MRCWPPSGAYAVSAGAAQLPESGNGLASSPWVRAAQWALAVATLAILVRVGMQNADELDDVNVTLSPAWLLAAAPLTLAGGLLLPLAWRQLLAMYGERLAPAAAVRVWTLAAASRYFPTGVVALAARIVLAGREGITRSVVALSLVVELLLVVAWTLLIGGLTVPSDVLAAPLRALTAAAGVLIMAGAPLALRFSRRRRLQMGDYLRGLVLFGVNDVVRTASFVLLAVALLRIEATDIGALAGAVNLAAAAGLIGITPAGIGVREAALVALLESRLGVGDAAALAVASRAWEFLFELGWLGLSTFVLRRSSVR